ncbi:hypothetical protein [Streptomyces sp. NPDC018000]|uniref:hypothetical protein n=1 Tax=Streptomyces sp. NPDC018000 TaxID=3365028 RepID=UPI0037A326D1
MQRDNTPETTGGDLSTEDLAQPRETDEAAGTRSQPSAFPGEGDEAAGEVGHGKAGTSEADRAMPAQGEEADEAPQLLKPEDEDDFRKRWEKIQNTFVDDPREAVHAADRLVANVMQTLATTFDEHKKDLEQQWNRGGQANTEALRTALRRYRSFFNRLLTT